VDTALANIYAKTQQTGYLNALIREPNDIVLSEVEENLIATEQYLPLCALYERSAQEDKLLDAWAKRVFYLTSHAITELIDSQAC
jgi:hypothetical protein